MFWAVGVSAAACNHDLTSFCPVSSCIHRCESVVCGELSVVAPSASLNGGASAS